MTLMTMMTMMTMVMTMMMTIMISGEQHIYLKSGCFDNGLLMPLS